MLNVQWLGSDETSCDPLPQLYVDVPEKVTAYVQVTTAPALTATLEKCNPLF